MDNLTAEMTPQACRWMTEEEFVAWSADETRAEWDDGRVEIVNAVELDHRRFVKFLEVLLELFTVQH